MTAVEGRVSESVALGADTQDQLQDLIRLDYQLLKDGKIDALADHRPDFEMQYPISEAEEISFAFFERYINNKLVPEDEGLLDAIEDNTIILNRERTQPGYRDHEGNRPSIQGFKLARFDRYLLEERLKNEGAGVEPGEELSQVA
jgi:hypothetical protein